MYLTPACDFELPDGIAWNTFIQYVLVPEVVSVLISEDMHITLGEAVQVWEESRTFGVRAFPDELDGDPQNGFNANRLKYKIPAVDLISL